MSRTTLKTKKHYDWQDIKKRFGFEHIDDVFEAGTHFYSNHSIVTLYEPCEDDYIDDEKAAKRAANRKRIFDELGEVLIHLWW